MQNIPLFTTNAGVGSLVLEEIPYKKQAYIRFQSTRDPMQFLKDCLDICKAVGAEQIFATGHHVLQSFPLYTEIWRMRCDRKKLPATDSVLVSVDENTENWWREIYNMRMQDVPVASTMTMRKMRELTEHAGAYFVYDDDRLIGIGKVGVDTVEAIATVVPRCGRDVLSALCGVVSSPCVFVEVATRNSAAVKLYEKAGFQKCEDITTWYCVYDERACQ